MPRLYYTYQYIGDLKKIYKISLRRFGLHTAQKTIQQIKDVEEQLKNNHTIGKIDPNYHSERFRFITIKNSQKIFFEYINNTIFMVTAGYDRRDWKTLLKDLEAYADQQISIAKKQEKH